MLQKTFSRIVLRYIVPFEARLPYGYFVETKCVELITEKEKVNILIWKEEIQCFIKKLSLWKVILKTPDLTVFPMLLNMVQEVGCEKISQELTICFVNHLSTLKDEFKEYFYEDLQLFH